MSSKGPVTPKGFRDILPEMAKLRRETINKIADVLEEFGFVPLETPIVEFAETLTGKYGEEEKLIYKFTDRGRRELALRYDLTVPLARFIANNMGLIQGGAFRRYQLGEVFRGENPQAGRYREFTQFDFDTVGEKSSEEDAKIIAASIQSFRKLGLGKAQMAINDRENFKDLSLEAIREIDKIYKVGKENIKPELLEFIEKTKPTQNLNDIFSVLENKYSLKEGEDYFFDPTLARGLDYYTSTVFEMKPYGKPEDQTVGAGGRYDNLIGMFAGKDIPAVGFSFGIDRITEILS
jgi:histidyl-tRNA synthetase